MSDLITKLLQGKSVDWKPLGEVAEVTIGEFVHKNSQNCSAQYPVYNGGIKPTGYYGKYNNSGKTVIISARGANAGFVNQTTTPYWAGNSCYSIKVKEIQLVDWLFLYYFLKNSEFNFTSIQQKGGIPAVSKKQVVDIQIPIPPLSVQEEIVQILDRFTAYTAELTAELSMRQKQYNHYRDTLLTFQDGQAEWKTLGEVGEFIRGNGLQKKDFTEVGFPAIHYGQIYTKYALFADKSFTFVSNMLAKKLRIADKNDLLIATTSENDEDVLKCVGWLGKKIAISGDMILFRHDLNVKYLAYYFQTEAFQAQKQKYISGTKVKRISRENLAKFIIPIPPLSEQERIVAILDKFDILTSSITEGLPREIELRQQQYEYYREQLLNFPKP